MQDPVITELLFGITKYMVYYESKDLYKHALVEANRLLTLIRKFYEQS